MCSTQDTNLTLLLDNCPDRTYTLCRCMYLSLRKWVMLQTLECRPLQILAELNSLLKSRIVVWLTYSLMNASAAFRTLAHHSIGPISAADSGTRTLTLGHDSTTQWRLSTSRIDCAHPFSVAGQKCRLLRRGCDKASLPLH